MEDVAWDIQQTEETGLKTRKATLQGVLNSEIKSQEARSISKPVETENCTNAGCPPKVSRSARRKFIQRGN
jgi:hypothetical protein